MLRKIAYLFALLGSLGLVGAFATVGPADAQPVAPARWMAPVEVAYSPAAPAGLRPCATEDSTDCYWDATTRGNGRGHSFIALADGTVRYLAPAGWTPVTAGQAADLHAWAANTSQAGRDWAQCWRHLGDTTVIVCPDGHVEVS